MSTGSQTDRGIAPLAPPAARGSAAKRHAGDVENLAMDNQPLFRSDIEGLLERASESCNANSKQSMEILVRNYNRDIQSRFQHVDSQTTALQREQHRLAVEQANMASEITKINKLLDRKDTIAPTAAKQDRAFDRLPDQTILRTNMASIASLEAVEEAVKKLVADVNLNIDDFEVRGPALGKSFAIKFSGDARKASIKVDNILQSLRPPTKGAEWKKTYVVGPGDTRVQMYVGPDKSVEQVQREQASKRLATALRAAHPGQEFRELRREGTIAIDWTPIAKISTAPSGPTIQWNNSGCDLNSVDKERVAAAFREHVSRSSASSTVSWTDE